MTPKFDYGDKVSFEYTQDGKKNVLVGEVYIVDRFGTFEQHEEPSYDVLVKDFVAGNGTQMGDCLFKHIRESQLKEA